MKLKTVYFLLILWCVAFSCNKVPTSIEVNYDSDAQKGILLVDGKQSFRLPPDSMSIRIKITPGSHTFKLNKEKEFPVTVPGEGGILNLNHERFVTIVQPYGSAAEKNEIGLDPNIDFSLNEHFVMIDSLIYYYKKDTLQNVSDADIRKAIEFDRKHDGLSGMRYFRPDIFIPKKWNFGLDENFPETITEKTKGYSSMITGITYKSKIVQLPVFKLYVLMNPQYFVIRTIKDVQESRLDKEEDSRKADKQMKFD